MTRILAMVLVAAYAVTSVGPRGIALCIGGDHGWSEMIAATCGGGGHSQGSGTSHHHEDEHAEAQADCCDHHQSEQHGPCTDITLDQDFARLSSGSSKLITGGDGGNDHGAAIHHAAVASLACGFEWSRCVPPCKAVRQLQQASFTRTIVLRL
jgi:hypothetical protein